MREIDAGLYVEGKLDIEDSELAREAWRSLKRNRIGLSFGYLITRSTAPFPQGWRCRPSWSSFRRRGSARVRTEERFRTCLALPVPGATDANRPLQGAFLAP
jgi:hypothetical protein